MPSLLDAPSGWGFKKNCQVREQGLESEKSPGLPFASHHMFNLGVKPSAVNPMEELVALSSPTV